MNPETMSMEIVRKAQDSMLSNNVIEDLSDFYKLFGDPTRVKILWLLDVIDEMTVSEISESICMSNSSVSHQLKMLRDAHLLRSRRDGKNIYYSLCDHHVKSILEVAIVHISEGRE